MKRQIFQLFSVSGLIKNCLLFSALCFAACTDSGIKGEPGPYFDTRAFFAAEIQKLSENTRLLKQVKFQSDSSTDTIDAPDWENEFSLFRLLDLDNPANYKHYQVDSVFSGDTLKIQYTALDTRRGETWVEISTLQKGSGEVLAINVETFKTNVLYKHDFKLNYRPGSGYTLHGQEDILSGDNMDYRISATFIK